MTGVAGYLIEFVRFFLFVVPKILSVDVDGHPHHFSRGGFHGVFIGGIVKAVGLIVYTYMAEVASHAQRLVELFHDTFELRIGNIFGQYAQIAFGQGIGSGERDEQEADQAHDPGCFRDLHFVLVWIQRSKNS